MKFRFDQRIAACMYLSFNKRAKSASTLKAVIVHNGTVIDMLAPILLSRKRKATNLPPSLESGDLTSTVNKLYEANAEITCNQISKQYFGRLMQRRFLVKYDKHHNISNNCSNVKEYVDHGKGDYLVVHKPWLNSPEQ